MSLRAKARVVRTYISRHDITVSAVVEVIGIAFRVADWVMQPLAQEEWGGAIYSGEGSEKAQIKREDVINGVTCILLKIGSLRGQGEVDNLLSRQHMEPAKIQGELAKGDQEDPMSRHQVV